MSTKPLISFIIPVYKTEEYLEKCLKSLIEQDYPNIEIICIMDGKSKKAEKLLSKIEPGKRRVVYNTIEHGGAPRARNIGFEYARGECVCFFDSDCYAEPGMVTKWMNAFERYPDRAFVYEGYRFTTPGNPAIECFPFDPYLLTVNNYISTCFPMKRDVFPGFDESLESLQDWDLWLTIVENGHKGAYLGGYSFLTEPPREGTISGIGCTRDNWLERVDAVKKKHGIPDRPVCFTTVFHERALDLARCAEADFRSMPGFKPNRYKAVIALGFHIAHPTRGADKHAELFQGLNPDCRKVIYWVGPDIEALTGIPFKDIPQLRSILNTMVHEHWCETIQQQQQLATLGIEAKIVPMPLYMDSDIVPKFPANGECKIAVQCDDEYRLLADFLMNAMPDIELVEARIGDSIADFKGIFRLAVMQAPDWNCSKFLMNGRRIISNIAQPHYGYVGLDKELEIALNDLVGKIRQVAGYKKPDYRAAKYYREALAPERFKQKVDGLC